MPTEAARLECKESTGRKEKRERGNRKRKTSLNHTGLLMEGVDPKTSGRKPEQAVMLRLMTLSARNRLEGKITELQLGGVMAHVVVRVGDNLIESVITRRSAEEMNLKVGDTVSAVIKSTEVLLEKK
jgi:molybdopterin-binding protein